MSDFMVGQEYEINYPYEGVDRWRRVRIVSVSDDGKAVWVRMVVSPGNSFPVPSADLRPAPSLSAGGKD